jgi:hypothetical protein
VVRRSQRQHAPLTTEVDHHVVEVGVADVVAEFDSVAIASCQQLVDLRGGWLVGDDSALLPLIDTTHVEGNRVGHRAVSERVLCAPGGWA